MYSQSPIALVMIDVDHFKQYNDSYGHQAGDNCLSRLSNAMKSCLRRPGDMLARYGGEEFACLLPETGLGQAMRKAEELGNAVQELAIPHASSAAAPIVTPRYASRKCFVKKSISHVNFSTSKAMPYGIYPGLSSSAPRRCNVAISATAWR